MNDSPQPRHPLGRRARILLTSVFGPYGCDDAYGSRRNNPMELYQNQVTRVQGGFSLRMFHRSFGLMMIRENIEAPCTLLDFPTLEGFAEAIAGEAYDIVGISAIAPNIGKVQEMCRRIRRHQPGAAIVIGGHIANLENLAGLVDADHIVRGEGVRWFQRYLGEDDTKPFRHPMALSGFGTRMMGLPIGSRPATTAAILIPSVGCPMGCNFCSTSALFGGKGKAIHFYETGDALFRVMCEIEKTLGVRSFFTLDENFLLHRKRALRLLACMEAAGKNWSLYVFSSARVLQSYTMEQLTRLGISWVWMGLEGKDSAYAKLGGVDTRALVQRLQSHGIRVLGSTIIGLETHRPETMDEAIEHAVGHETVFHQFMLYTPVPGTPLYEEHKRQGTLLPESALPRADAHGQFRFNYRHAHFRDGEEERWLLEAFARDFRVNGPSLLRMIRVMLDGWKALKDDPREPVRRRIAREVSPLRTTYAGALWAIRRWYRRDPRIRDKADRLLRELYGAFGWLPRLAAPLLGRVVFFSLWREERRLASGWSYEPRTFCEKNAAARALEKTAPARRKAQGEKKRRPAVAPQATLASPKA